MGPLPKSEKTSKGEIGFCLILAGVAVAFLLKPASAEAREAESDFGPPVPCATVTEVAGEVDVLDSSRTHLLASSPHSAIPCGGWVSVGKGSVELHHRDGFRVHVGAGSFVQFQEPNLDGKNRGDQLILFRGQVFAQAGGGNGELRVITANSRVRIKRGSAVVVYSHEDEETQLIALDSISSLENRFETSRSVQVKPGEATSLNFKQLRVVPSTPRAVASSALRPKFEDLRVPERDRLAAVHAAQVRQERVFATALVEDEDAEKDKAVSPGEEVRARLKKAAQNHPSPESYSSHENDAQTQVVHKKWVNRMVAGEAGGEKIVAPALGHSHAGTTADGEEISLTKGTGGRKARRLTPEDEEKLKLIDELSRIHED